MADGLEQEYQDYLDYQKYLASSKIAPPSVSPDLSSTVELDSSSPETTPDQSRWGRLLDWITEQSMVPPASAPAINKNAELIYPKTTIAGTDAAKESLAKGLTIAGAMAGPELLGAGSLAAGAGNLARLLSYGKTAFTSALGAAGGNNLAQVAGLTPDTTISDDAKQILTDTAIGTAAPIALNTAIAPLRSLAGYLNKPARIAKMQGATPTQMDLARPISENYKYLEQNVPEFAEGVVGSTTLKKSYDAAKTIRDETGKEIRAFYKANQNISAPADEVFKHPNYVEWFDKAAAQSTKPEDRATIQHVLDQFDSTVGGATSNQNIPLQDLWDSSKDFGNELATNVANPSLAEKVYRDLRQVYVDTIQKALQTSNAPGAPRIAGLNKIFSNVFDITKNLSRKAGVGEGETLLDNAVTKAPLSLKAITGNFAGLGSNPVRAMLYNLNRAIPLSASGMAGPLAVGANEAFRPDAVPLPRTAEVMNQLPQGIIMRGRTLLAHQTASSMGPITPESAQLGEEIANKFTADATRVLTTGTLVDREIFAHSSAAMIPGLFAQQPGAYPSELDGKILTSIDGESQLNAALDGMYGGRVPTGDAFDQIHELNTKKLARVFFRPGEPIQMRPKQIERPDVNSLVSSFETSQGQAREPTY